MEKLIEEFEGADDGDVTDELARMDLDQQYPAGGRLRPKRKYLDQLVAGMPLLGTYRSYCGGHRLNFSVLEALFSSRSNYAIVEVGTRREAGYAEIGRVAMAAFAPDVH
jgi:hypothetical protein